MEDKKYENFTFLGGVPHPMFIEVYDRIFQRTFTPETGKALVMSMEKLKDEFFHKTVREDFKNRVEKFCKFFHFDEKTVIKCMNIYDQKTDELKLN